MTTVLKGLTWDHPRGFNSMRAAARAWHELNPDIRVDWTARSLRDFSLQPLGEVAGEFDLLVIDHPHVPHAAAHGLLQPLDGLGYDDCLRTLALQSVGKSHQSYRYDGHQYGLAIDAAAQVAAYRPDLCPAPPSSWDDVFQLAGGGGVLWPATPLDALSSFLTLAANAAFPVAVDSFIQRDAGLAILQHLHKLKDLVPADCASFSPVDVAEQLAAKDDFWYAPLTYGYVNYSRVGFRKHRIAYVDMPAGVGGVSGSCLGGAGIAVSASSRLIDIAARYAFWLATSEVQRGVYYLAGGQPAHASAWDDAALNDDSLQFFRNTRRSVELASVRPQYDGWMQVQRSVGVLIGRALSGEIDDASCLAAADVVFIKSMGNRGTGQ